jgi:hypothetical protein
VAENLLDSAHCVFGCPLIDNVRSTGRIATAKKVNKQGQEIFGNQLHSTWRQMKVTKIRGDNVKARNKKNYNDHRFRETQYYESHARNIFTIK